MQSSDANNLPQTYATNSNPEDVLAFKKTFISFCQKLPNFKKKYELFDFILATKTW